MSTAPSDLLVITRGGIRYVQPICDDCGFIGGIFSDDNLAGAVAQANIHDIYAHADASSIRRPAHDSRP